MPKKKPRAEQSPSPSSKPALKSQTQASESLFYENEFNRLFIANAGEGICVCHEVQEFPYLRFTVWNNRMTLITGYSMDEINRLGWYQSMYPDPAVQERAVRRMQSMRVGDDIQGEEWEITRADGQKRQLLITTRLHSGGEGEPFVLGVMNDITEQKRADEALRESEARYHRIVTTLTDYIFTSYIENDRVVKTVHGPGCIAVTGYSAEEFIADPYLWFNMVHPEDRDRVIDHASRILSNKDLGFLEHRIQRKDGKIRWVSNTPVPYYDSSGVLHSYDGLIRDITERKQAEEALRDSEERWRTIVAHEPECVKVFDREGKVLEMNPAGLAMIQATFDQVRGRKAVQIVAEEDKAAFNEMVEAVFRGETRHLVFDIIGLKGRRLTLETTSVPLKETPTGKVKTLLGVARDITERKRAEEQLRKLSLAVEQSPATIVVTDTHGNIEYVNPTFTRTTGYTFEEALGKNPRILKSGEMPPEGYKALWETITAGREWRGEFHNRKKNGELYWEAATISPVKNKDKIVTHFVAVKENITERRKAESEIRLLAQSLASTKDSVSIADLDDRIIFVNDAFLQTYRYTREELMGRPISIVRSAITSSQIGNQILAGTFAGGWYGEILNHRKDGSEFPIELWTSAVKDESGAVVATVGVARDITERKRVEKALRESEERFRSIWEKSADGMRITNEAGDVLLVNDAYCRMMEKPRAEIEGKPMSVVYEEARKIEILNKHQQRFSSRSIPPHIERTITLWNGKKMSLELSNTFLSTADQPIVSLSIFRDVTERKQAEELLKESVSLLQATLESTTDGILVVDKSGKITSYNTQFAEMWSIPDDIVSSRDDDRALNHVLNQLKEPEVFISKVRDLYARPEASSFDVLEFKDGKIFERYSLPQRIDGKPVGRVWSFRDITKRRLMEGEREKLISELQEALANIKTLSGLIPICASCKKIRDDKGYWNQLEKYIIEHSEAKFTHGICPECAEIFRSEIKKDIN